MTRHMPPGNSFVNIMRIGNPYAPNPLYFKSTTPILKIEIIGVSKNIAQAKYAGQLAVQLATDHPDEKTAVVLGNESLLTPALSAIDDIALT